MPKATAKTGKPTAQDLVDAAGWLELVDLDALTPHPRNYRDHPDDQIEHLIASLDQHGWYRNIVIARDGTILAGHGIAKAAQRRGDSKAPAHRLDLDPFEPRALRVLAGDNELTRLAEVDDRELSELLKEIQASDEGLLGTGLDDMMLANLLTVTRTAAEIPDFDAAAEWVGMPDYEAPPKSVQLMISFRDDEDRAKFIAEQGIKVTKGTGRVASAWWPAWAEQRNDYKVDEWAEADG